MERKIYLYTNELLDILEGKWVVPPTCEIDLSNKCTLNCEFCLYASFRKEEGDNLPYNIYVSLLQGLLDQGVKSITFTGGGESLCHPNAVDMIRFAKKSGFDLGLITNGVLLDKLPDSVLLDFKFIRISLDAATSETYKKVKGANSFTRVIQNLSYLCGVKKTSGAVLPTIGISYVVCDHNNYEIQQAKTLAHSLGVDYIQFKPAWVNGKLYELDIERGENTYITNRYEAKDTLPCSVAGLIGIVSANGKMYFCCQHRGNKYYELGDLRKDTFATIWKRRKNIVPKIKECPRCRYMNYAEKFNNIPKMLIAHRNFL